MSLLKDICIKIGSGATPRGGANSYLGGNFSLIRSQNVLDFVLTKQGLAKINDEQAKGLSNVEVLENDVLLNITGDSVARCCQVDKKILPARVNQHVCIIRTKASKLNSQFLKYWLLDSTTKAYLLTLASSGATRNALTKRMIENLEISEPSLLQQNAIAHILGTLDDKIELNQKMNQTLEDIAKAIFKSWFIDFDPVRAKAEGLPTGLPPKISDFFPDEFVESEIGEIPRGWQHGAFSRFLKIQGGFSFKSRDFGNEGFKVVKIKNIYPNGTVNLEDCDRVKVSDQKLNRFILFDGNVVIAMTGATVGKVGLISVNSSKIYLNQRVGRVVPNIEKNGNCWFSYLSLSSNSVKKEIELLAYGSAQPNISSKDIEGISFINPLEDIILGFNKVCSPVFQKVLLNIKESQTLALLRDALLPKLISGELRIPDAEKFLEEAGV